MLPLSGDPNGEYGARFEDGHSYDVSRYAVSPGYCETMGIALRRGRLLDQDQPIIHVATMERLLAASASQRRFALIVFEGFALVALLLAATGIYGVLAANVTERAREIGVRSALGASRGDVLGVVLRQGMALTMVGMAIGIAGAAGASRALITLLFGVSPLDPVTYLAVAAILAIVSALACWAPAWRASRVDPAITLRAE